MKKKEVAYMYRENNRDKKARAAETVLKKVREKIVEFERITGQNVLRVASTYYQTYLVQGTIDLKEALFPGGLPLYVFYTDNGTMLEAGITVDGEEEIWEHPDESKVWIARLKNGMVDIWTGGNDYMQYNNAIRGSMPDDLRNEVGNRTGMGAIITALCKKSLSDDEVRNISEQNQGLATIIERYPNVFKIINPALNTVVLVPSMLAGGIAIGWQNNEYIIYQYLDAEAVRYLCGTGESQPGRMFVRYIDRTDNMEKVFNMINSCIEYWRSSRESISPFCVFAIPLSWDNAIFFSGRKSPEAIKQKYLFSPNYSKDQLAVRRFVKEYEQLSAECFRKAAY